MGTCCNKDKDPPASLPLPPEPAAPFRLTVTCEDYELSETWHLSGDLPLSALKDMILRKMPQVSFKKYCMKILNKELIDDTASLKQLLIQTGDQVRLEPISRSLSVSVERHNPRLQGSSHQSCVYSSVEPSRRKIEMVSQLQQSVSELIESEDQIRLEVASSKPTHAILRRRLRDMSSEELKAKADYSREILKNAKGKRLWETALRTAPPRHHVRLEELDMSSTTNRSNEYSLKERFMPSSAIFNTPRIQEQSVVMESDESYNQDESHTERQLLRQPHHPRDFFQELNGLYSGINRT
jgi:hypothetical protein